MSNVNDPDYLRGEQYRDAANLEARIALHGRFSSNGYGWFPWLFDQLCAGSHASVLDIGCGSARLWAGNRDRLDRTWRAGLCDFSAGMVADARAALARVPGRWSFTVADATRLPFGDRRFDCVLASHMLYHVVDRPAALREIARVLAPGGRLLASTVGAAHMGELDRLLTAIGVPANELGAATSAPFTLENGGAQLAAAFRSVERHDYADGLVVTEVEPVLAYARSMLAPRAAAPSSWAALRRLVDATIAAEGAMRITKATGVFVARA